MQCLFLPIKVEPPVAGRSPRRSLRAIFPYRAPQLSRAVALAGQFDQAWGGWFLRSLDTVCRASSTSHSYWSRSVGVPPTSSSQVGETPTLLDHYNGTQIIITGHTIYRGQQNLALKPGAFSHTMTQTKITCRLCLIASRSNTKSPPSIFKARSQSCRARKDYKTRRKSKTHKARNFP